MLLMCLVSDWGKYIFIFLILFDYIDVELDIYMLKVGNSKILVLLGRFVVCFFFEVIGGDC